MARDVDARIQFQDHATGKEMLKDDLPSMLDVTPCLTFVHKSAAKPMAMDTALTLLSVPERCLYRICGHPQQVPHNLRPAGLPIIASFGRAVSAKWSIWFWAIYSTAKAHGRSGFWGLELTTKDMFSNSARPGTAASLEPNRMQARRHRSTPSELVRVSNCTAPSGPTSAGPPAPVRARHELRVGSASAFRC